MKIFFAAMCISLTAFSCCGPKSISRTIDPEQGIAGYVKEITGNQMPSPDAPQQEGTAIKTTVHVFEPTAIHQVKRVGTSALYETIQTKFIKSVETDDKGYFAIELPPGRYSLFTMVGDKFYSNSFDSNNFISPVTVREGEVTRVNLTISERATF